MKVFLLSLVMVFGLFSGVDGHVQIAESKVIQYEHGVGG